MNIAVLSGKGGTGKTTVSTNLALALKANYTDCDVEEPNGFLFLKPEINTRKNALVEYPFIDKDKCVPCGECVKTCKFNALAKVREDIILFEKLCHGCGACEIVCKVEAISYKKREIGIIEEGSSEGIQCRRGVLNISEPMAVPIIKDLLKELDKNINVIDCPPGTSCNVVNSLKYAHGAILVTEPTAFGLHDMNMAIELVKLYNIPFGIVINKDEGKDNIIRKYCKENNYELIGAIPYSNDIAVVYSKGEVLYNNPKFSKIFDELSARAKEVLKWS